MSDFDILILETSEHFLNLRFYNKFEHKFLILSEDSAPTPQAFHSGHGMREPNQGIWK